MTTTDTEQLRRQIEQQRSALGRDLEALGDHVSPGRIVERRRAAMGQRVRRVKDALMGAAEGPGELVGGVGDAVGDTAGSAVDMLAGAPQAARERTQGSPLGMGAISFGIGFVAGSLLPATRQEQRLVARVEPTLQHAAEEVGAIARESVDDLRPRAEQAALDLRDDAADAARTVQETAKERLADVEHEARQGVSKVAEEVRRKGPGTDHPTLPPA